jgi:hypothetical protein
MIDHVLNYLRSQSNAPVTVDEYCELNYSMTWAELRRGEYPEWEADVLGLIEDGELKVLTTGSKRKQ